MTCSVDSTQCQSKSQQMFYINLHVYSKIYTQNKGPRIAKTVLKRMKVKGVCVYIPLHFIFCCCFV